jgi:hypothetical protein
VSLIASAETLVNVNSPDDQTRPSIASLPDGGWIATWTSMGTDGSLEGIYQRRFNADGSPNGSENQVNLVTAGSQLSSSVAVLDSGEWVVAWTSLGQDSDQGGIYFQRYTADGVKIGGETLVNTNTVGSQYEPSVTALQGGGFTISWTSQSGLQDGSGSGVYQQRFDADGIGSGPETKVNGYTVGDQDESCIASLANGGWVVAWTSNGQDGSNDGVYLKGYHPDGSAATIDIKVNTTTPNIQSAPAIATLADGGFVATWMSLNQDGDEYGIYQQRFNSNFVAVGEEQRVNTETSYEQVIPAITALPNGGWVVSWVSNWQDGDDGGIFLQCYDADGSANGGEYRVNTQVAGNQINPTITALTDGGFVVAWQTGTAAGDFDIHQKVFHPVVNAAPAGTDMTLTIDEGSSLTLDATMFGFSDTQYDTFKSVVITNIAGNGVLTNGALFIAAGDQIDVADLDQLHWIPGENASGDNACAITFQVVDNGGTSGGGVDTDPTPNILHLNITPINDAPSGTSGSVTTTTDQPHVFSVADFGFHDEVDGNQMLAVVLHSVPTAGTLTLNGANVLAGQEINAADFGNLVWTPPATGAGTTALVFRVRDDGGTANGGVDYAQNTNSLSLNYGPHQAPAGSDINLTLAAHAPVGFSAYQFQISDPDGDQLAGIVISSLPTAGTLTLAGAAVAAGQEIPASQIGNLLWTPPAAGAGTASFQFQLRDDGSTANGGVNLDQTPNNVTITYGPHQAPQGADIALYVLEDAPISFSANQFLFADADGDHMAGIIVSSLPASGTLTLNGQTVVAGAFIAKAEIAGLSWTPVKNQFGDDLGNFTFQVVDDGSLADGGQNTDQTASLFSIHVSDVIDRFIGTAGRNNLVGTAGKDLLDGRAGNDKLTGAAGGDVFVFRARDGRDVVTDFDASPTGTDIVDIRKIAAIADFTDLTQNHMHEAHGNVIIDGYGTSRITLKGVAMADLTADDFLF